MCQTKAYNKNNANDKTDKLNILYFLHAYCLLVVAVVRHVYITYLFLYHCIHVCMSCTIVLLRRSAQAVYFYIIFAWRSFLFFFSYISGRTELHLSICGNYNFAPRQRNAVRALNGVISKLSVVECRKGQVC